MAPDRKRSPSPMGRSPLPATVMNVKMCCAKCEEKAKEECEEVEGVVKVVTDQGENKVIVYGVADPSALLKKMRRHLDKHAMYWHTDDGNSAAPPLFPVSVDKREGIGPPLQTGSVDFRDRGPPPEILQQRELQNAAAAAAAAKSRERELAGPPQNIVREVVFVDSKDGTPVDPRNVRERDPALSPRHGVDARDLVRPVERMELRGDHGQAPREVVVVPVEAVKDQVQHHRPRDGELREVRRAPDPRDHGPPSAREIHDVRPMRPVDDQLRPIDLRNSMRNPPPPREPVLDRGRLAIPEGLVPVRTGRDPRDFHSSGNGLGPRSPRDAEYLSPRLAPPDHGPRSPRGDPAAWDYDHGPQAPRSPRFEPPRSPGRGRDGYDPRSRPGLDRELSFSQFGSGPTVPPAVPLPYEPRDAAAAPASFDFHAPPPALHHPRSPRASRTDHEPQVQVRGYGDIDPLHHPRSPRSSGHDPDPPLQVRGYGDIDPLHQPRSPRRSSTTDHQPQVQVRGYGDIDPRQFRPAPADHPASIRPVERYSDVQQDTMIRNRDADANLYRDGGPRSPRYYSSEPPTFRSPRGEVRDGEYYEPKESYFSDYHPSQNYQPGPLATQDIDELPVTNPSYKKHILSDPTF